MRKRERENQCEICGHYHRYEEGEVCGVCGHRAATPLERTTLSQDSAFPSVILPHFLYLGSYYNASCFQLLKAQGITHILNTIPASQNLHRNAFTYHSLQDDGNLAFDDAIKFLEQCERDKARVLVHCMFGKNRSPAIIIAYLMKCRRWRLTHSYQWVKGRRPSIDLNEAVYQQLKQYEVEIFGSDDTSNPSVPIFTPAGAPTFDLTEGNNPAPAPVFSSANASIFTQPSLNVSPQDFTFRGSQPSNPNGGDIQRDSS